MKLAREFHTSKREMRQKQMQMLLIRCIVTTANTIHGKHTQITKWPWDNQHNYAETVAQFAQKFTLRWYQDIIPVLDARWNCNTAKTRPDGGLSWDTRLSSPGVVLRLGQESTAPKMLPGPQIFWFQQQK